MRVFLDSNVLLRYFLADNPVVFEECAALLHAAEQGRITPIVSAIVLLEFEYVLRSVYTIPLPAIIEDIGTLLAVRGIVLIDKTNYRKAFALRKKTGVKMSDCLIAMQVGKGMTLCTYDREFRKIPGLSAAAPKDVLARLGA